MDSVHPFIQTGICFRAQICCMLRLNCLKAARRKADHLLKQTREIIGIAKANILSPQEPKVQWFAAVQVRTECGHSCDILCGSAIRKVLNVFSRFCQALDIKTALYRGSGMRPFLFLDNKRRNLSLPRSQPAVSLPASCAYTRTSPLVQLTPAIADFYPPPGCSDHKRAGFHQPDSPPAMKKWSAA